MTFIKKKHVKITVVKNEWNVISLKINSNE